MEAEIQGPLFYVYVEKFYVSLSHEILYLMRKRN